MSLLTVVQDVCEVVGVTQPSSVFGSITGNRTMQEMLALANEMAKRISGDNRDWTALVKTAMFVGDGITTAFNMPVDYRRMLKTSNVWRSSDVDAPLTFVDDPDQWLQRRNRGSAESRGEWTMQGGQMLIMPVMAIGTTASFAYIHNTPVRLFAGGLGSVFMNDNDGFVLDERLLKLGMIWQWRANKGSSYAEDMGTYDDAMSVASGSDRPAPIYIGRSPLANMISSAYPWQVP
jgi:hypothetical protein